MKERENKSLLNDILIRTLFIQANWNFERMQNVGFLFAIKPLLKKLYPNHGDRKKAMIRHLEFFNTNPYVASIILGLIASMEEDLVKGKPIKEDDISTLKTSMAGPLAAIGDKLFWTNWRPFVAVLSIAVALLIYGIEPEWLWVPVAVFLIVYNTFVLILRLWGLRISYHFRKRVVRIIAKLEIKFVIDFIRYSGLVIMTFIFLFYFATFGAGVLKLAAFFLIFGASITMLIAKIPPEAIFYLVMVLSISINYIAKLLL